MKYLAEGLGVLDDIFMRSEELIKLANESPDWRAGTVGSGGAVKDEIRQTDVFVLKPGRSELEDELTDELVNVFGAAISVYGERYTHLNVSKGEGLRIMRYPEGGFYKVHTDARANERILSGILYLNTDIEGGHTLFPTQQVEIQPREGRLVLFPSNFVYPHESLPVTKGVKYAVVGWFS
jgi:Rps23 Pro-64 3,4-dihydroxylase Tpa1-like proline 4-hydroxylase